MVMNYLDVLRAGRYEMQGHLATGGMSVVYRAWDRHLCRPVAIKVLREDSHDNVAHIARFCREARTASLLHSPYIVEFYDFFEEHGTHYMAMELIEGVHLKNYIVARRRLAPVDALLIAEQICLALTEVHAQGFLHRDIKPQNILLDPTGNARLADFGIVHIAAARSLTSHGMVLGTADYISPEQAQGLPLGPTTDLYSLGVVLFEMLAGALPFTGTTPVAVAMQHATLPPPSLRSLVPATPRAVERLVQRALTKRPGQRFQSAYDMGMALRQVREELQLVQEKFAASGQALAATAQTFNLHHRHKQAGSRGKPGSPMHSYPADKTVDYAVGNRGYDDINDIGIDGDSNGAVWLAKRRLLEASTLPVLMLFSLLVLFFLSIVFLHILR